MGILSSIGKAVGSIVEPVKDFFSGSLGNIASSALSSVGDFLGGSQTAEASEKIARMNIDAQAALNAQNEALQREFAAKNEALQREFAQMGIRWKVEDAKAAGLHPLFALGSGTLGYSPSAVVGGEYNPVTYQPKPSKLGAALKGMGQSLERAALAQATEEERALRLAQLESAAAQTNRSNAEADLAYAQAQKLRSEMMFSGSVPLALPLPREVPIMVRELPPIDYPRSGSSGGRPLDSYSYKDDQVTSGHSRDVSRTAGEHSLWQRHKMGDYPGRPPVYIDLYRGDDPGEQMSEGGIFHRLEIIRRNVSQFGWGWLKDYLWPGSGQRMGPGYREGRIRR